MSERRRTRRRDEDQQIRGRRKEDQIAKRVVNVLKITAIVLAALFVFYKAAIGMYVDAVLTWRTEELRMQQGRKP